MTQATQNDTTIIEYVNKLIRDAVHIGASDIHFEPYEKSYRIRYRQDGILYEIDSPSLQLATRLSTRIKILARLDIAERRIPQDGGFQLNLTQDTFWTSTPEQTIDCRVSTCPTLFGEKVVLRLLDPNHTPLDIDTLGFEEMQKSVFLKAIRKPQGLILVTGPTGSGKTVSLYTALHLLNTPSINISTCEDPVEIYLPGINQVHVNPKAGLTFDTVLRSFLRQDPDILMVGEMRDLETATLAVQAAETGHLVLSTLHANNAASSIMRLSNMGVPAHQLASSISLIVAQRLARRLCTHGCTHGCQYCQKGYKGRVGIYECMPITPAIRQLMLELAPASEIQKQACTEGMWTLSMSALHKVQQGITSMTEINRVLMDSM